MLLDRSENIDKSNLGRECMAVVDVRVATRTVPAVHWRATRQNTQQNPLQNHEIQLRPI